MGNGVRLCFLHPHYTDLEPAKMQNMLHPALAFSPPHQTDWLWRVMLSSNNSPNKHHMHTHVDDGKPPTPSTGESRAGTGRQ